MTTTDKLKEEFLTCVICSDVYKDPVTLHCGHTFCTSCLTSFTKTQRQAIAQKVLPCANCRQMTKVPDPTKPVDEWASQLKTGFFIKGLVEAFVAPVEGNRQLHTATSNDDVDEYSAVVMDLGSSKILFGFASDDAPRVVFPTVVGHSYKQGVYSAYVGDSALSRPGSLTLKYPIEHGIITNWDDMEKIWHHAYQETTVDPKEMNILLATSPLCSGKEHEKITEIMFEKFDVPAMFIAQQGPLSMHSNGQSTGIVLGSGAGTTWAVPVVDSYQVKDAIITQKRGGDDVTDYLQQIFTDRGSLARDDKQTVEEMKEKIVYVALDYTYETDIYDRTSSLSRIYTKSDGQVVDIGKEIFTCTETLFQPSLFEMANDGIHEMIHSSILKCQESIQTDMYSNIMVAGGNTFFPGFVTRLEKEISSLVPGKIVKIASPPERKYSPWIGGSILGSISSFQPCWKTKQHYQESGVAIAHQMFG